MAARSISSATISFGLVSIPVRLFPATSSKSVSFNLLHAPDKSRIQQKVYCPVEEKIVERSELVRGYEFEKGRYVTFTDEELKALESRGDHSIEISEFIPLPEVDPVYYETQYYLGCEPTSAKAYRLLAEAMTKTERVGLAKFTMRGKEHLVIIRPFQDGLMMHTMYYADEVRSFKDIDHGANVEVKPAELSLAERLISDLTEKKFEPGKYADTYRDRVIEAAERKLAGHEVTETVAEAPRGNVIDLMSALKASLKKRGVAVNVGGEAQEAPAAAAADESKPERRAESASRAPRARKSRAR